MTIENSSINNGYPLKNTPLHLHFTTVPGSEVLGLFLVSTDEQLKVHVGNYSAQNEFWHHKNSAIFISADLLEEIVTLAKSYAIARAVRFGNLNTLVNGASTPSTYKQ